MVYMILKVYAKVCVISIPPPVPKPPIKGCMDVDANNFNMFATAPAPCSGMGSIECFKANNCYLDNTHTCQKKENDRTKFCANSSHKNPLKCNTQLNYGCKWVEAGGGLCTVGDPWLPTHKSYNTKNSIINNLWRL